MAITEECNIKINVIFITVNLLLYFLGFLTHYIKQRITPNIISKKDMELRYNKGFVDKDYTQRYIGVVLTISLFIYEYYIKILIVDDNGKVIRLGKRKFKSKQQLVKFLNEKGFSIQ